MADQTPQADNLPQKSSTEYGTQLSKIEASLFPANKDMIQKMLTAVAVTLQIEVPTDEALRNYFHLFKKYPEDLLRMAGESVLKEHRYPRFPFPADFLKHIDDLYEDRLKDKRYWLDKQIRSQRGITAPAAGQGRRGPRRLSEFKPKQEKK
jgi:hypothetical protein